MLRSALAVAHGSALLQGSVLSQHPRQPPRLLSLHGGGQTDHRRMDYLLAPLAAAGWSSAAFDHIGHGATGGSLQGSSLNDRLAQARSVVTALGLQRPDALIASSMGGHTACSLLDMLQPRTLILYCPAAYVSAAEDLPFGPAFQHTLRTSTDFAASPAFVALRHFRGQVLLVWGEHEQVIPPAVQQLYADSARAAASLDIVRLPGADHRLHLWLQQQPEQAAALQQRITQLLHQATAPQPHQG
ncbi:alpha/beta fold hydrolase [Comamonas sp. GB3 AK4-5]|uniref:alpha/beta fold hydrolase n=1 Tax=Comamonas sp. GB3 AK4-5 TaxID=3231487 RepID=UPI00351EC5EB